MENTVMSEYVFGVEMSKTIVSYIKELKKGAAPGYDGVSSEHLKIAITIIIVCLCQC